MFAHCLLPALLLLATVYYCKAVGVGLPLVVTNKVAGSSGANTAKGQAKFSIPNGQCYGVLPLDQTDRLRCPNYGSWKTYLAFVNVTIYDYKKASIKISLKEKKVTVGRNQPCLQNAVVDVVVGCNPG